MKKIIIFIFALILSFNTLIYAASYENVKHAVGIDFGTTIFSAVTLPGVANLIFQPKNGATEKLFKGGFGIRFTYNYRYLPKQAIDATFGIYTFSGYYNGVKTIDGTSNYEKFYNADVVAIPASIGVRFYFNKRDKDNYGDMDIAKMALPKFKEALEYIRNIFKDIDYSSFYTSYLLLILNIFYQTMKTL